MDWFPYDNGLRHERVKFTQFQEVKFEKDSLPSRHLHAQS